MSEPKRQGDTLPLRLAKLFTEPSAKLLHSASRGSNHLLLIAPAKQADQNTNNQYNGGNRERPMRAEFSSTVANELRIAPELQDHMASCFEIRM